MTDPAELLRCFAPQEDGMPPMIALRFSWLETLADSSDGRMPPRRQDVPEEAILPFETLEKLPRSATGTLPLVACSHMWVHAAQPDPTGNQLQALVESIRKARERDPSFPSEVGVVYDSASLFQIPRSGPEDRVFRRALSMLNTLYTHQKTMVMVIDVPLPPSLELDESNKRILTFHERAWPFLELSLRLLVAPSHASPLCAWPSTLYAGSAQPPRPPPLSLADFDCLAADKHFTSYNDRDSYKLAAQSAQLSSVYATIAHDAFASVDSIDYSNLGWDAKAIDGLLAGALLRPAVKLVSIDLSRNPIGAAGVALLAHALQDRTFLPALAVIDLQQCLVGSTRGSSTDVGEQVGDDGEALSISTNQEVQQAREMLEHIAHTRSIRTIFE